MGRVRGQRGSYYGKYEGLETNLPPTRRPPLPPGGEAGGHGGSHGHLMNEFIAAILEDREPLVDIAQSLAMTVAGIVAHRSALRDGETMKIPQYRLYPPRRLEPAVSLSAAARRHPRYSAVVGCRYTTSP